MFCRAVPPPAHSPQSILGKTSIFWKERIKTESRQNFPPPQDDAYDPSCNENTLSRLIITDDRKTQPMVAEDSFFRHL